MIMLVALGLSLVGVSDPCSAAAFSFEVYTPAANFHSQSLIILFHNSYVVCDISGRSAVPWSNPKKPSCRSRS
jgi:hypothetical protein